MRHIQQRDRQQRARTTLESIITRGAATALALFGAVLIPAASWAQPIVAPGPGASPIHPPTPAWVIEPMGAWGGPVHAFERHGDIGYVGSGQRLVILDMSDPTDIQELGTVKLGSTVMDFKVRDGLAYVATVSVLGGTPEEMGPRRSGFHVVDVADVHAPELIWSAANHITYGFHEVDLWGDIAFVRERSGTMWAADLTDPRAPVLRGVRFLNSSGSTMRLNDTEIHGDLAYVAVQESLHQFQIFDLSAITPGVWPAVPQRVGTANFFIQREARKVAVEGDWAYVLGRDTFVLPGIQDEAPGEIIWAVDVSDPAAPVKHGSWADFSDVNTAGLAKPVSDLAVSGGRLYATDDARFDNPFAWDSALGLAIFDVGTNPGQPALIASHRARGDYFGVTADGDTLYLLDRGEGLMVMDASDPAAVVKMGGYHSPASIMRMVRRGDRLYVADRWSGLSILDVSDLSRPVLLGVYQTPERLGFRNSGLAVDEDGMVYLAAGRAGLEIVNASDPANPFLRSAIRFPADNWVTSGEVMLEALPGHPSRVVYMPVFVGSQQRLFSIDVSNPALPQQADPSPPSIPGIQKLARYAPGRFLMAPGGFYLYDIDGSDPTNISITHLNGSPWPRFASVAYHADTGIALGTYGSQHDGTWFVTYDIEHVDYGAELASVPMVNQGDIAAHPKGAVVLGRWANTPNRVTLMGLNNPAKPEALASAPLAFTTASVGSTSTLRASVLAGDDAVFVANHQGSVGSTDDLAGLETFRVRRTADRNADGVADARDLLVFLDEVSRGDDAADLNGDGAVNALDVIDFLRRMDGSNN